MAFSFSRSGILAVLACTSLAASAQSVSPAQAAVKVREQRVALLRDEMKAIDTRIESRVGAIVEALRSIGDSKETRSKVTRIKRDTIDRLERTIASYRQKRAAIQEELRRPTVNLTVEQKRKIIAKFDERIEKRVQQILELQQSLPGEKDYDRYKVTGSNWTGTTYEYNEDYRQNQRLTAQTNAQRDEISTGLRASIARLDQHNRELKANGGSKEDIARNEVLLAERRKQLATGLKPVAVPTRTVGDREAADLDKALKTAVGDLRTDFDTLFARYYSALQEAAALNSARAQLPAAKT